jgi:catechol 2,3-dioxygenase-like lactoylglutathione lyase family enzyme
MTISRAVPNIRSGRPAETRDFFVDLLGFEVAMDLVGVEQGLEVVIAG